MFIPDLLSCCTLISLVPRPHQRGGRGLGTRLHTYAHSDDVGSPTLKCLLLPAWHRPPLCTVTPKLRPCRPEVGTLLVCPSEHFDMEVVCLLLHYIKHSCMYEQVHPGCATLVLHSEELQGTALTLFELGWTLVGIMIDSRAQIIIYTSGGG